MPKSRVRKKNGKKVKHTPKPKGLSKTKMKKLMEMIQSQNKSSEGGAVSEIRSENESLEISSDFTKKLNVNPSSEIDLSGPSLSEIDEKISE
jgi:hypothetical protein